MAYTFKLAGRITLPNGAGNPDAKFMVRVNYPTAIGTGLTMVEEVAIETDSQGNYSVDIDRAANAVYRIVPKRGASVPRPFFFPPLTAGETYHIGDLFTAYSSWSPTPPQNSPASLDVEALRALWRQDIADAIAGLS